MHLTQGLIELAALLVVLLWLVCELMAFFHLGREIEPRHLVELRRRFDRTAHKSALLALPIAHPGWKLAAILLFGFVLGMIVTDSARSSFSSSRAKQCFVIALGFVIYGAFLALLLT
jgi:hypothetical protein